ncbi:MAG: sorbosone dehydrogenase family protein [Proteobacteria bacterium]|nr:MAG: sorbosone dehydrogenase family protein [Pseudomonadota bacterium]
MNAFLVFGLMASATTKLPLPDVNHKAVKIAEVAGWKDGEMPKVPEGFEVKRFADSLDNPRWVYTLPNGDVLVAESNSVAKIAKGQEKVEDPKKAARRGTSANRITLLRDKDGDGKAELRETFLGNLNQPLGMLLVKSDFYVANTDSIWKYTYSKDATKIEGKGQKILDLTAGGYNNHWTRNIILSDDGKKIYISVGSSSNVAEHGIEEEKNRANILEINLDGSGLRVLASGLRNPVGMDIDPVSKKLWTAVNERDNLGDDLVPDYITSVKDGGFYGWPYSYFGQNEDPRLKGQNPKLVASAIVPDLAVGSHTASLGLAFQKSKNFPAKYQGGVFIGQHGSWNRSAFSGYKVTFVPFKDGKPSGEMEDFVTGFIKDEAKPSVYGRPVGVAFTSAGNLLVADDAGDSIWQVSPRKK